MNYPFKMIFVFVKIQMLKMSSMKKKKSKTHYGSEIRNVV